MRQKSKMFPSRTLNKYPLDASVMNLNMVTEMILQKDDHFVTVVLDDTTKAAS